MVLGMLLLINIPSIPFIFLIMFSISFFIIKGEIAVQDCALLIAELTAELQLIDTSTSSANKQQSDSEREKEMMYNLIQTCVLLKLLGRSN